MKIIDSSGSAGLKKLLHYFKIYGVVFFIIVYVVLLHSSNSYLKLPVYTLEFIGFLGLAVVGLFTIRNLQGLTVIDLLFLLWVLTFAVNSFNTISEVHTEYLLNYTALFTVYFLVRMLKTSHFRPENVAFVVGIISISLEFTWFLLQSQSVITNRNPLYLVGGANGHPAFTLGSVAIFSPFLFDKLITSQKKNSTGKLLALVSLIALLFFTLYFKARAATLAIVTCIVLYLIFKNPYFKRKIYRVLLITGGFIIALVLFFIKFDSSASRFFIWKNTILGSKGHLLTGVGLGKFKHTYNKIQEQYFIANPSDTFYINKARYIETAYNDFLEILLENGIITAGILVLLIAVLILSKPSRKVFPFYVSLICFIPLMLTWSTLKFQAYSIPFALVVSILSKQYPRIIVSSRLTKKILLFIPTAVYTCGCLLLIYATLNMRRGYKDYQHAIKTQQTSTFKEASKIFYYDSRFLIDYADNLLKTNHPSEALEILNEAQRWDYSPKIAMKKGEVFEIQKKYHKAEIAYLRAYRIAPYHTYPKFLLAKIALIQENCNKAIDYQKKLETDYKTRTITTDDILIREKLNYLINEHNCVEVTVSPQNLR
jgi:hypothetical protein